MNIQGDPENIKEFMKYFIFEKESGTKEGKYLARTFLEDWKTHKDFLKDKKKEIKSGNIDIYGWCAWSCWSCWFEGYPNKKECATLKEACKKCNVVVLCDSEESGMCFQESLGYNGEDTYYSSKDMPTYKCKGCGNLQSFATDHENPDEECFECEENKGWEFVK